MKKTFLVTAMAAGMMTFASCDSANENRAEEKTEQMEDTADDADSPALEEGAEEGEDSVDAVDPQ
ncbi:hypothetical protein ACD591_13520 [Rufibacter glacialis]|uniref:Entericidin n=1 Tax=Rufibacter glacialis TaxID=1259555 RepID=A0A5M8Q8D2_9BACT|nr:hypothetical protein [Rufibacter glacialis]KAA6431126.1 hypothetical protein FOE74_18705 [Rufibacter glacialis]GGK84243.1 hypothetical protein GCM10011405_35200 [Rufibacter glacialis]